MNRRIVLGAIPSIALAAIVTPMALFWSDLPDPMATHWGISGNPNGSLPPTVLLIGMVAVYVAIWVAVWRMTERIPFDLPSFAAGLAGIGGLLATVQWISVWANRGAADWTEAGSFSGLHLLIAFGAALAVGFAGWRIAGGHRQMPRPTDDLPMMDLAAGETVVWSSTGRGPVLIVTGVVVLIVAVAVWSAVSAALVAIALLVLSFSEVRATVAAGGVAVSLGWLGIPSWTTPLSAITQAEVEEVSPMAYGGWGYRLRPGVRAIVVKGGPSLRLVRTDMPDLVVTVDNAETGAAAINGLLDTTR